MGSWFNMCGKIKVFLEKLSYEDINFIKTINNGLICSKNILVATRLKDGKREILSDYDSLKNKTLKSNFINISKIHSSSLKLLSDELWF